MTTSNHKIVIPGYRIIKKIGEGGMSVVYLAFQESLKREVALKVMRPVIANEQNVVKRFEQEAEIIAKLYHPNIVSIYEVGHVDDEVLFYSMPYLQHSDLSTFVYHDDEELKAMLGGICDGLAHAHNQGIVHRDIKPENILFDQFGNAQIADFGIALSTGRQRFTKDRKILGSVFYMSPEQAESKPIDARSDVYSLGAILYELLTGEPVFDRDSDLSIMMAHLSDPVPELPPEVSHWRPIINRCLAKSPNQRFQNMAALKQAVMTVGNKTTKKPFQNWWLIAGAVMLGLGLMWFIQADQTNDSAAIKESTNSISSTQTDPQSSKRGAEDSPTDLVPEIMSALSDEEINVLVNKSKYNIERKQLTTPVNDNALDDLLRLLSHVPDHPEGLELLSEVMADYYQMLYESVLKDDLKHAETLADSVAEVRHRTILSNEKLLLQLETHTEMQRSLMVGAVVEKVQIAKKNLNQEQAKRLIGLVDKVIPGQELVDELLSSIESMLKPGQILKDDMGITSVVITPQYNSKRGLLNYGLAVSVSEITWEQYDRFASATDRDLNRCKSELKVNLIFSQRNYMKPGFKVFKNMPVVCVSWRDANDYAAWLSKKTGLKYRLPTRQEWRHLRHLSGKNESCGKANLAGTEFPDKNDDARVLHRCNDGSRHVAPITKYPKNSLNLIGFGGNVSEWISGCERLGKFKAILKPNDLCDSNPIMGRSWISGQGDDGGVQNIDFDEAWTHIGFRLVRDLRKE